MPSGAKRRKAAKKKKETTPRAVSNGNGDVKVVESDGGENSSPASQEFEPQQNPFSKYEAKETPGGNESMESEKDRSFSASNGNEKVVEIVGEANSDSGGKGGDFSHLKESADEKMGGDAETESSGEEVVQVEDSACQGVESNGAAAEKAVQVEVPAHENVSVEDLVGAATAESKSTKNEEKVHPAEPFSSFKETSAEMLPSSDTDSEQPSEEIVSRQLQQSDNRVSGCELHAGSSDCQQFAEKEPLLRTAPRPVNKTSWTGCCGLLELFTSSSR